MLSLPLGTLSGARSILCLGAHCDDIDIGCGGTLLQLARRAETSITWVIFSSTPERAQEARTSAAAFLGPDDRHRVLIKEFRDGFLPYFGAAVKDEFEGLKDVVQPDLIFTHTRDDLHQDHRLVCELTWNTFRNHLILEYEIPKWDGDLGRPNVFVPLPEETCRRKAQILRDSYPSQAQKAWFTEDLFLSLPRLRGMESNAASGYAEAFTARKLVLDG